MRRLFFPASAWACPAVLALVFLAFPGPIFAFSLGPAAGDSGANASQADATLHSAREQFAAQVKSGILVNYDEKDGQVVFRSSLSSEDSHRPGPLEDEMIAGAIRGKIAETPHLASLKLVVEAESGRISVRGSADNAAQTAGLISLALEVDGVREVRADLPSSLRGAASVTQNNAVRGPGFPAP